MKKIISLLLGSFLLASSAYAGGMVGVKVGVGDLEGSSNSYTAGDTTYSAQSGSKDSEYAAIFAEFAVSDMISVGVEYVPLSGVISIDGNSADSRAEVSDFITAYLMVSVDAGPGKLYAKAGYADAQIGTVSSMDRSTVNAQSDALEGPMLGIGFQTAEGALGDALDLVARLEATYTDFDDVSITTTSNGSASVKKTASGELTTFSLSLAKSF